MSVSNKRLVDSVEIVTPSDVDQSNPVHTYVAPETSDAVKALPFKMLTGSKLHVGKSAGSGVPAKSRNRSSLGFQLKESKIQNLLELSLSLNKELDRLSRVSDVIGFEAMPHDFSSLNKIVSTMDQLRVNMSEIEESVLKDFFTQHIIPLTNQSEFCRYAYEKPRGYAGDFVMMDMIWNGRTKKKSYKFQGSSTLGKLINAYTLDLDNCRANEWRIKKIASDLVSFPYKKIASIGSGSAIELELLFFTRGQTVDSIDLFDQDSGALQSCVDKYSEFGIPLNIHEGNIVKSILRDKGEYDFLYSSGMFDYFNLESSQKLIRSLWDKVLPGGKMLITNANPESPSRLWVELVGDWYLLYKSQHEMLQLIWELPNIEKVNLELDPFKVYQYISVSKL